MALLATDGDRRRGREDERVEEGKEGRSSDFFFLFFFGVGGEEMFALSVSVQILKPKKTFMRDGSWTGKKKF